MSDGHTLTRESLLPIIAPVYLVGLDLGQSNDPTALIVAERLIHPDKRPTYPIRHIRRLPLLTSYPEIVNGVYGVIEKLRGPAVGPIETRLGPDGVIRTKQFPKPQSDVTLIIDYTGVGHPVLDMFLSHDPPMPCPICAVNIIGGADVNRNPYGYNVPKRDLASTIQRLLQEERIIFPKKHPMTNELRTELLGFRVKISLTGHDSYGAGEDWRSAPHDDLVLAAALACWYGESAVEVAIY